MDRVTPDSTGPQRPVPDCETARAALSARLDGQLDSPEASWLERHLGGCPACRTAEHELAVLQRLLMEGPVPRETELIASRRSILGSAFGSTGRLASGSGMWPRWLSWGLAPALGLALTVAALWTGAGPTRQLHPSSDRPGSLALAGGTSPSPPHPCPPPEGEGGEGARTGWDRNRPAPGPAANASNLLVACLEAGPGAGSRIARVEAGPDALVMRLDEGRPGETPVVWVLSGASD